MVRKCRVCGAEYETCLSCEKNKSWRTLADTMEHYYILGVLMDYQSNHDADTAYQALLKRGVDACDSRGFLPSVQKLIDEIGLYILEKSAKAETSQKAADPVDETQENNITDEMEEETENEDT